MEIALLTAAGIGALHTIAGPDHYVPLIALGRVEGWSRRRAAVTTAACGLVHCASAATVVVALLALARGAGEAVGFEAIRGQLAALVLVGLGCVVATGAWRRRRSGATGRRPLSRVLVVAFVLGPCEWLVPSALAAAAIHGAVGAGAVCAAFTLGTVATMVAAVDLGTRVVAAPGASSTRVGLAAGLATAFSGMAVLFGL